MAKKPLFAARVLGCLGGLHLQAGRYREALHFVPVSPGTPPTPPPSTSHAASAPNSLPEPAQGPR
ncbi:MAG: hypothetical protein ACRDTT_07705, partial [Pseudonocardiaceae bacterium]